MIQIVTGTRWNKLTRSLSGIGVVHRGPVVIVVETLVARREDTYVMHYREVNTGFELDSTLIGADAVLSYSSGGLSRGTHARAVAAGA